MENRMYYKKYVACRRHLIGGSVALRKQLAWFTREASDLDIMLDEQEWQRLPKSTVKVKKNVEYWGEKEVKIYSVGFSDGSKIDFFVGATGRSVRIGGVQYLVVEEVFLHKIVLIERLLSKKNKHLNDLKNYFLH